MRTIQMTIDEGLLSSVDQVIGELGTTRSAFIRASLEQSLARHRAAAKERRHRAGYERLPVVPGEFDLSESDLVWPEK